MIEQTQRQFRTTAETLALIGYKSNTTLNQLCKDGFLTKHRQGRRIVYAYADIINFLNNPL